MTDKKVDYIKHRFDLMPSLGPDPRLFQTIIERHGVSIKMLAQSSSKMLPNEFA